MKLKIVTIVAGLALGSYSFQAFGVTCNPTGAPGTYSWNSISTWDCGHVPTINDDVSSPGAGYTVIIDTNASAKSIQVGAGDTFTMNGANTLTVNETGGFDGITIYAGGTFNGGSGAISVTANRYGIITNSAFSPNPAGVFNANNSPITISSGSHNIYNSGTFNAGSGAINTTITSGGIGLENDGSFVSGAGAVNVYSLRNGYNGGSGINASLIVGSGGIATTNASWGDFVPFQGTVTLNGNLTVKRNIAAGTATFSGAGKIILTDDIHALLGPVSLQNLEIVALTAPRTINFNGLITTTGTTKLNGSSPTNLISFGGAGSITAFTSSFCAGAGSIGGITCNAGGSIISAPINLSIPKIPATYAEEISVK